MPSPHEFAGLVIRALRSQGETRPIRYDPSRFSLIIGEETSYQAFLSHLYDEFCVTPWWRRKEVLSRRSFSGLRFLTPPGQVLSVEQGAVLSRARTSLRLIPTESVSAALLEGERSLAQGVVTNLSEAGARLLTNARVDSGRSVRLRFRTPRTYLLETEARVVWSAEGVEPSTAMVGALHGVMFTDLPRQYRERIRSFLASDAFPVGLPLLQAGEENLDNPFQEIADPDIERLVSVDPFGGNEFEEMVRELYPELERLAAKFQQKAMTLGSNLRLQRIAPGPRRASHLPPGDPKIRMRDVY